MMGRGIHSTLALGLLGVLCLSASLIVQAQGDATTNKQASNADRAGKAPKKKLSEAQLVAKLDHQVEAAIAAQTDREDAEPVLSQLVAEAPAAQLASGDADTSTTGACAGAIDAFCQQVKPGEGRLAECLTSQIHEEDKGNVEGRTVGDACKAELGAFKQDRAVNINKDLSLARACKADAKKYCKKQRRARDRGAILACLRQIKPKLTMRCQKQVTRTQQDGAEDFQADAQLYEYCKGDATKLCADVVPGGGRIQECLRNNSAQTSWECKEDLFRQAVENADDVRLSVVLLRTCMGEKQVFCGQLTDSASILDCLEDSRMGDGFGSECRAVLETNMERRSMDFRLDAPLRKACATDIRAVCGHDVDSLDSVQGYDARVTRCLQSFRDELQVPECAAQVHKAMQRAAEDIRFNHPLAEKCSDDREKFCPDVQPGSARVMRCLQEKREELSFECGAALFDQEVLMAEDIDFKWPLQRACSAEMKTFCSGVPNGHARIIRCLQEHSEAPSMSSECQTELSNDSVRSSTDYRLNYRLRQACEGDVAELCPDVCSPSTGQACGGRVLRCLTDHSDKIQEPACREEVLYFEKKEVTDFRNDAPLAKACRKDVSKFCKQVKPGQGRVHECLQQHLEALSAGCRKEETKLSLLAAQDVRLRPRLRRSCSQEIAFFCSKVKPGKGRMMQCLQQSLGQPQFGAVCRQAVDKRAATMQADWRQDGGVAAACATEVQDLCAAEADNAHGHAEVLKCLMRKLSKLGEACAAETSRAARTALWEYTPGAALTQSCDADVQASCANEAAGQKQGQGPIGSVGHCLAERLASAWPIRSECRELLLAAAPADTRAMISANSAQSLVKAQLRKVQKAAQSAAQSSNVLAKAKLINQEASGRSIITLTGWVAAAAIAAMLTLVIVGLYAGIKRLVAPSRPYTVVRTSELRDGDL